MKSILEEGFIGVDMPPLPDEIWQGVGLLQLTEETFFSTSSDTLATWSIPAEGAITTQGENRRNGIIRWYDPITGRWLSNDPIGISGGLNQYVFCADNPVNFVDPLGLWTVGGGAYGEIGLLLHFGANVQFTVSGTGWNPLDWRWGGAASISPFSVVGTGIGGSAGGAFTWSGVDRPEDWGSGWSPVFGGSVTGPGQVFGYDVTLTEDECGNRRKPSEWKHDLQIGVGAQPTYIPPELLIPVEVHGGWTFGGGKSSDTTLRDILRKINQKLPWGRK